MTREQRRQRNREKRILLGSVAVVAFWAGCMVYAARAGGAFDGDAYKTGLSVIGAVAVLSALMRVLAWLDTPRGR